MDSSEFPSLSDSNSSISGNVDRSTLLGSSWAEVAQPHGAPHAETTRHGKPVDNRPGIWETQKDKATFSDIAGREKKQVENFPTPQESLAQSDTADAPASGGVGDLLHSNNQQIEVDDPVEPPNPDRSFAAVISNKGFPKLKHDTTEVSDQPPLSDLSDVKDMLEKPSVIVPPVPPAQSFAQIAAKEIPPENRPLSERAQYILNHQPKEETLAMNHENFPTLSQSNLMAEENAPLEEKAVYSEISRFNEVAEETTTTTEVKADSKLTKSFADITGSNLENAPPSAKAHVDQLPVYNEEEIYMEMEKREEIKKNQVKFGNNEQLIKEEKEMDTLPDEELEEVLEKEKRIIEKDRDIVQAERNHDEDALAVRLHTFDRKHNGVITIFDTISALYRLNYSWFAILPGAIFMHLRLSPLTSPYGFPFIYRSLSDFILLPIYTKNLIYALTYKTPMLHQGKDKVSNMVEQYGRKSGSRQGLGYWDGLRAMHSFEQNSLRWWQLRLWALHRVQWTLTYTMLHEPKNNLVTAQTLISLSSCN